MAKCGAPDFASLIRAASWRARVMLRFSASVRDQATLTSSQAGSLLVDKRMNARLLQISWNGAPHEQQIPALLARHGERRLFRHACRRTEHGQDRRAQQL